MTLSRGESPSSSDDERMTCETVCAGGDGVEIEVGVSVVVVLISVVNDSTVGAGASSDVALVVPELVAVELATVVDEDDKDEV